MSARRRGHSTATTLSSHLAQPHFSWQRYSSLPIGPTTFNNSLMDKSLETDQTKPVHQNKHGDELKSTLTPKSLQSDCGDVIPQKHQMQTADQRLHIRKYS